MMCTFSVVSVYGPIFEAQVVTFFQVRLRYARNVHIFLGEEGLQFVLVVFDAVALQFSIFTCLMIFLECPITVIVQI